MIQKGTVLKVIDNSGAKKAACIHMYQGYRRRYAKVGDVIKVAIKKVRKKDQDSLKIKKKIFSLMFKKFKKVTSKTKIVRRCVLTGRSKSSLRFSGISRIKMKELIRDRKIFNGSKNSW